MATYAGPRFAFVEPAPDASINQRLSVHLDLSFAHRLMLASPKRAMGVLSRETLFDRLARRSRYSVEPQARDMDFDRRIYAALDDAEAGRALIARPEARQLILGLFELGVKRIVADRKGLNVKISYAPSPAMDGGQTLSAIATRLDALANFWPREEASRSGLPLQIGGPGIALTWAVGWIRSHLPWPIDGRGLALAWCGGWLAAIFGVAFFMTEHEARQIERFVHPDWIGMTALLAAIVLPAALLAARRADAHKVLSMVLLSALLALPFSAPLRVVEVNRLVARDERSIPAEIVDLIESDTESFAVVMIADRPTQWRLASDQAYLAREQRLCASGKTVEGWRGLRYVRDLRVWPCRQLDDMTGLKPS